MTPFLRYVDEALSSERLQVRDRRFGVVERLVGGAIFQRRMRKPVFDIYGCLYGLCPEAFVERAYHCAYHFEYGAIEALGYSV